MTCLPCQLAAEVLLLNAEKRTTESEREAGEEAEVNVDVSVDAEAAYLSVTSADTGFRKHLSLILPLFFLRFFFWYEDTKNIPADWSFERFMRSLF